MTFNFTLLSSKLSLGQSCNFCKPLLLLLLLLLIHEADPPTRQVVIIAHFVRSYVRQYVRMSMPTFQNKTNFQGKQCSLLARLWAWPSGSLMTPVLSCSFCFITKALDCCSITIMKNPDSWFEILQQFKLGWIVNNYVTIESYKIEQKDWNLYSDFFFLWQYLIWLHHAI